MRAVLDGGLPVLPSGVLYPRALPLTYAASAVAWLFGVHEWSLRLVGALCSTATVPVLFVVARRLLGTRAAWVAAALAAVSYWEVATAQNARMYAPLTLAVLGCVALALKTELDGRRGWRPALVVLVLVACFLHQIAGALGLMFALLGAYLYLKRGIVGFVPVLMAVTFVGVAGNFLFEQEHYGRWSEIVAAATGDSGEAASEQAPTLAHVERLIYPLYGTVRHMIPNGMRVAGLGAIALIAGSLMMMLARPGRRLAYLAFAAIVATMFVQQLTFACLIWLAFAVVAPLVGQRRTGRDTAFLALAIAAGAAAWVAAGVYALPLPPVAAFKRSIQGLLAYPPNFLRVFLETAPWLTLAFVASAGAIVRDAVLRRRFTGAAFALALFCLPLGMLGLHPLALVRMYERYVYFLNPYFLLVLAWGLAALGGRVADAWRAGRRGRAGLLALPLAAVLLLSGGAGLVRSLALVSTDQGTNRWILDRDLGRAAFFPDYRGPARFVCASARPGDLVIATDILGFATYCDRVDAQFILGDKRDAEGWMGRRTVPDLEALAAELDAAGDRTVWFAIAGLQELDNLALGRSRESWEAMVALLERRGAVAFTGADGRSRVYRIPPE